MKRVIVTTLALFLVGACKPDMSGIEAPRVADLPSPVVDGDSQDFEGQLVTRRWHDVFKENGEHREVILEVGYDYGKKSPFRRQFDADGNLESEEFTWGVAIGATSEETNFAFELVKADPRLAKRLTRESIIMHGGFTFFNQNDPLCGIGSRCLHVFATDSSNNELLVQSLVDLISKKVVYPDFEPRTHYEAFAKKGA